MDFCKQVLIETFTPRLNTARLKLEIQVVINESRALREGGNSSLMTAWYIKMF